MIRLVVGGQIDKEEIRQLIEKNNNGRFSVDVKNDLEAAISVKMGAADYYIGACYSGGGGALAMAFAVLGIENCVTLSLPGNVLHEQAIRIMIHSGKIAFGITAKHKEVIVLIILDELEQLIVEK
ncbi:DUF2620 domain-containing protein [Vagococcus zengguangii]|uniref:DUF2620 domain-containing protein n=1 Tax=Vagococcus zengguangii TaxID=2571750 RepID=UPI00110991B6|nr:DUF2620 domain-containing protein [Vagococcus zengguangii]TLG78362.1 DUF2620 domain-containing protein [Vagococcus zengguangii]